MALAVLLALSAAATACVCDWSPRDRAQLDLQNLMSAVKLYYGKKGRYPATEEGLQALVETHNLDAVPRDPWGSRYRYVRDAQGIELRSWGADRRTGGTGEEADIVLRIPIVAEPAEPHPSP